TRKPTCDVASSPLPAGLRTGSHTPFRFPEHSTSIDRTSDGLTSSSTDLKWRRDKSRRLYSVRLEGVDGPNGTEDGTPGRSDRLRRGIRARRRDVRAER